MELPWSHARCRAAARSERALLEAAGAMMAASRDSAHALLQALAAALTALEPAIDAVLIFHPDGDELRCSFSEYFHGLRLRLEGDSLPSAAAARGHHVALGGGVRPLIPTDRAAVAVPVYAGSSLLAVVYAAASRRSEIAYGRLARAVGCAGVPYAIAREREADRASATYDGLTGLHTARAFRRALQDELRTAALGRPTTLALWFVDTDGFKSVNDAYGHAAGDRVLQRLASILRAHVSPVTDLAARNGGDEFCAVLRGAHKTAAIARAQEFCDAVRACDFGTGAPITASIGVAAYPYDAAAANELLEIADAAMYHSKRSGRDRVAFPDGSGGFTVHR